MLLRQLDLGLEAKNLERFQANFPPEKSDVLFPRPLWPYISPDVLVESYIEGEPVVGWAARKHKDDPERQRISIAGSEAFIKMLFVDNFVHGDLHPGNIFVTPSGQLAFLDAGIAVTYVGEVDLVIRRGGLMTAGACSTGTRRRTTSTSSTCLPASSSMTAGEARS